VVDGVGGCVVSGVMSGVFVLIGVSEVAIMGAKDLVSGEMVEQVTVPVGSADQNPTGQ